MEKQGLLSQEHCEQYTQRIQMMPRVEQEDTASEAAPALVTQFDSYKKKKTAKAKPIAAGAKAQQQKKPQGNLKHKL